MQVSSLSLLLSIKLNLSLRVSIYVSTSKNFLVTDLGSLTQLALLGFCLPRNEYIEYRVNRPFSVQKNLLTFFSIDMSCVFLNITYRLFSNLLMTRNQSVLQFAPKTPVEMFCKKTDSSEGCVQVTT